MCETHLQSLCLLFLSEVSVSSARGKNTKIIHVTSETNRRSPIKQTSVNPGMRCVWVSVCVCSIYNSHKHQTVAFTAQRKHVNDFTVSHRLQTSVCVCVCVSVWIKPSWAQAEKPQKPPEDKACVSIIISICVCVCVSSVGLGWATFPVKCQSVACWDRI